MKKKSLRACEKEKDGNYVLTYTGLVVFGKSMSLRRLLPALRVDYIRVSGNRWIEDPDKRFEATIDMRGPLILLVNRALNAIKDDLPKGFELKKGNLQADTPIDLPNDALREALVNAFIHCSFRLNQPIQIIRYSNRLEIINPGFSLKSPETLGEPGSVQRNPFISTIFHDTNLAETKGSGIRSMRGHMKKAGMMPPTFESNRSANQFTARLLLHHLLDNETILWLASYSDYSLNNEQRLALVFVREVGAIDNITYRQLNSDINNQRASFDLHDLCTKGLLEQKGQSRSTYYITGEKFVNNRAYEENHHASGENNRASGENNRANGENNRALPEELLEKCKNLKKWESSEKMKNLIVELCTFMPLSLADLVSLTNRKPFSVRHLYLIPLLKEKKLFYTIPEMLNHPDQKYTTVKK